MQRAQQFFRRHRAFAMTLPCVSAGPLLVAAVTSLPWPLLCLCLLAQLLPVLWRLGAVFCAVDRSDQPEIRHPPRTLLRLHPAATTAFPKTFKSGQSTRTCCKPSPQHRDKEAASRSPAGTLRHPPDFESVGSRHLGEQAAQMPFFTARWRSPRRPSARSIMSAQHCLPTSRTALCIWSTHLRGGCPSYLTALQQAGYRRIYLTAVNTAHYGL